MFFKAENFENFQRSLIYVWFTGIGPDMADLGPDLVRIGIKKLSEFGPILINLGPIWQVVALLLSLT